MIKRIVLVASVAAALAGVAAPANAAGTFCYDAEVVVNGSAVVDQAGCQDV